MEQQTVTVIIRFVLEVKLCWERNRKNDPTLHIFLSVA